MREELIIDQILTDETATATSDAQGVAGARKISFVVTRTGHSAGSATCTVEVSIDGNTWVALNKIIDNTTNTNTETIAHVASVALSSDTTKIFAVDVQDFAFPFIRLVSTESGTGTINAYIAYEL